MKKSFFVILTLLALFNLHNVYGNENIKPNAQDLWYQKFDFEFNMTIENDADDWIEYGDGTYYLIPKDYKMVFVNGVPLKKAKVYIENGNVFLPLRQVSEELDFKVDWNQKLRETYLINGNIKITVKPNDSTIKFNELTTQMDKMPYIVDGTMYVPIDFFVKYTNTVVSYFDGDFENSQNSLVQWQEAIFIDNVVDENRILTKNEALEYIKLSCLDGLVNFKRTTTEKLINETGEDRFKNDYMHIEDSINNIKYIGETERFYIYEMSVYRILYDKVTAEFYFNYTLSNYEFTVKFDEYNSQLYWHRFLVD